MWINIFLKINLRGNRKGFIFALTKQKDDLFKFCGCGVIGSHARLRIWCREAWGFESLHPHRFLNFILEIFFCENSSVGRARPCQGRGRGFESRFSLNFLPALVVELVDTQDLKSCIRKDVRVQVPSGVLIIAADWAAIFFSGYSTFCSACAVFSFYFPKQNRIFAD